MRGLIVTAALAGLTAAPPAVRGAEPATCTPANQSAAVLDQASRPVQNGLVAETGRRRPYWARQRASYARDLQLSRLAREYQGDYDVRGYDVASRLIRAKYNVELAQIAQVGERDLDQASDKLQEAARQLQGAFLMAQGERKSAIGSLQDSLATVTRSVSLCQGPSGGDNRAHYQSLLSDIDGVTDKLLGAPKA